MSAFSVSESHINAVCTWAVDQGVWNLDEAQEFGDLVSEQNTLSLLHRYGPFGDDPVAGEDLFVYRRVNLGLSLPEMASALGCIEYQCCEHPEWEQSEAFRLLGVLKSAVLDDLMGDYSVWHWSQDKVDQRICERVR